MRNFKFSRGLSVKLGNKKYKFVRNVEGIWQLEDQQTGAYVQFSSAALNQLYTNEELEVMDNTLVSVKVRSADDDWIEGYLNNLVSADRELIVGKRWFLLTYINNYGGIKTVKMIENALEREWNKACPNSAKPSGAAVLKWLSKFEKSDHDIRSLFPRFNQCGNRKKRISEELEIICSQVINEEYMTRERHTLEFVLERAISKIDHENRKRPKSLSIQMPTISTMRSILKGIPKEEIFGSRFGTEVARLKYRTSIGSSVAEAPLSVVEIDHTRLDGIAVDELTGLAIDRPWLTVVIDRFTRCILGFYLCFEPPSHASVAAALKHAIMPKSLHPDVQGEWPMYGIPMMIVVDNGLEFHGQALKELCAEIGINISFCPRKKGWAKGTVERVIGTINRNISELIPGGRTFHSTAERGDYDSIGKACVSIEALRIAIEKYIVDIYHDTHHRGINCKPKQKWEKYVNFEDIRLPANPKEFEAISGNIDTRKVFHYGVEINNVTYNSAELMKYRDTFKGKVTIRWNTNDLGNIHIMIPNGPRIVVPVHPSMSYLKGMSYYVWKVIQSDMRRSGMDIKNKVEVANRATEIIEFMEGNAKKNKQTRQNQYRFREGSKKIVEKNEPIDFNAYDEVPVVVQSTSFTVPKMKVSERYQTIL